MKKVLDITGKYNKEEKGYDSWRFIMPLTNDDICNINNQLSDYEVENNNSEDYCYDFKVVEENTIVPIFYFFRGTRDQFWDETEDIESFNRNIN
jgi:hypothetical protein